MMLKRFYVWCFVVQAEDGIRDCGRDWSSDVCSSDLRAIGESPLRMETLGWARKFGYEQLDNSHRIDAEEAMRELSFFKWAGGQTVIDQTPIGLGDRKSVV